MTLFWRIPPRSGRRPHGDLCREAEDKYNRQHRRDYAHSRLPPDRCLAVQKTYTETGHTTVMGPGSRSAVPSHPLCAPAGARLTTRFSAGHGRDGSMACPWFGDSISGFRVSLSRDWTRSSPFLPSLGPVFDRGRDAAITSTLGRVEAPARAGHRVLPGSAVRGTRGLALSTGAMGPATVMSRACRPRIDSQEPSPRPKPYSNGSLATVFRG